MTEEWKEDLRKLLFEKERTPETLEEVYDIYKKVEAYLINFPFEKYPYPGYEALEFVCRNYDFKTVLDIGCGEGYQSNEFLKRGKRVTAIDYGKSGRVSPHKKNSDFRLIIDDFNKYPFGEQKFDCVWAAHILEHQLDPHMFLRKVVGCAKEGGILAITVPPYKEEIIGGHVSLWNAGLLLYHLILAGCDCRDAHIKKYGYNISVGVEKKTIDPFEVVTYDVGDIQRLRKYFPREIEFYDEFLHRDTPFDGNIWELNWK